MKEDTNEAPEYEKTNSDWPSKKEMNRQLVNKANKKNPPRMLSRKRQRNEK